MTDILTRVDDSLSVYEQWTDAGDDSPFYVAEVACDLRNTLVAARQELDSLRTENAKWAAVYLMGLGDLQREARELYDAAVIGPVEYGGRVRRILGLLSGRVTPQFNDAQHGNAEGDPAAEEFWQEVHRGWDIEPRAYFEREAPKQGFSSPIAMAIHYMWKRDVRVDDYERVLQTVLDLAKGGLKLRGGQ